MKIEKPIKAVILVGGEGTRLRPLTCTTTKAMVPVLNMPFIQHVIHHLSCHNATEIILAMGYKPDSIKNHFEKAGNITAKLIYSVEETPLGTAGAVKNAAHYIDKNETLFIFNGDIFTDLNLTDMFNFHRNKKASVTIALTPVDDPTQFGVVELNDQQRVTRFIEKPRRHEVTSNLINAGIYIMESEILECIPYGQTFMFEHDVFPRLITDGAPVYGYPTNAYWIDMGTPEKYLRLNNDLLLGKCQLGNRATEKTSNKFHHQAKITGSVLIDEGCAIGKSVQIKGPSVIGSKCSIGDYAVIEESVLWSNVQVGEHTTLQNCIVAHGVTIEDNVHIENAVVGQDTDSNQFSVVKSGAR